MDQALFEGEILRGVVDRVIGVDTARDTHAAVIVDTATGGQVAAVIVTADQAGYDRLLEWVEEYSVAGERAWAVEGTGSYGRGLCRALARVGEWVIEVDRPQRRRGDAKSDPLDALRAGREVLGRKRLAAPRSGGDREAARVLVVTRESAVRARTAAVNALKALVVTAPEGLRDRFRGVSSRGLIATCARLGVPAGVDREHATAVETMRALAGRIRHLDTEIGSYDDRLEELTATLLPTTRARYGVGAVTAAQAYISWSHPGRCRSDAAFARLGGAAPIEASTGQVTRHRLDRGGDRQLNRALHTIAVVRMRGDQRTRAYVQRRRAENKTDRDIRRCLKRYIARELFRTLNADAARPGRGHDPGSHQPGLTRPPPTASPTLGSAAAVKARPQADPQGPALTAASTEPHWASPAGSPLARNP